MALTFDEVQGRVIRKLRRRMEDGAYHVLSNTYVGNLMHQRNIMLMKMAMTAQIAADQSNMQMVLDELDYPFAMVCRYADASSWSGVYEGLFYRMNNDWSAERVHDMPSHITVSTEYALATLGLIGGSHDSVENLDTGAAHERWVQAVEWADREIDKVLDLTGPGATKAATREAAKVWRNMLHSFLVGAKEVANRHNNIVWDYFSESMIAFEEFAVRATPAVVKNQLRDTSDFYDAEYIYLWHPNSRNILKALDSNGPTTAFPGLTVGHEEHVYSVRNVLRIPQSNTSAMSGLSDFQLLSNGAPLTVDQFSLFMSSQTVATTDTQLDVSLTPTYTYSQVRMSGIELDRNRDTGEHTSRLELGMGDNEYTIEVISQNQIERSIYTLTVNRT